MTTYDQLVAGLSVVFDQLGQGLQYWIGLAGAPGSGKSTLAEVLRKRLPEKITVIPMDGYHYYRNQLDAMEDPEEAYARRGAPFTFDAERCVRELVAARKKGAGLFPSFDHGIGDPIEEAIELKAGDQIVIVEGNYVLLDRSPWSMLKKDVFDETWFLEVNPEECDRRVENRHVATGLTRKQAAERASSNDRLNADLIRKESARNANRILQITSLQPD